MTKTKSRKAALDLLNAFLGPLERKQVSTYGLPIIEAQIAAQTAVICIPLPPLDQVMEDEE